MNASARDAAGNVGNGAAVSVRLADVVPPDVVSVAPADGATNIDPFTSVVVRFSEPMDRATLNAASIQLLRGSTAVATALVIGGNDDRVTLTPTTQPLTFNTSFTVGVSTAVADLAGNTLAAARALTFTTAPGSTTPLKVASIDPSNDAVDVSLTTPITVTFSQPVERTSVTPLRIAREPARAGT